MTGIMVSTRATNTVLSSSILGADIVRQIAKLGSKSSTSETNIISTDNAVEERLFDALSRVKRLTAMVAMHLDAAWRENLFIQLDGLHDPAEWEVDDEPVKESSFATFLKAIVEIRPERRPGLGLSQAGHLIAAWTTGRDRLTIEFLPNDQVRWVLSRYYDDEPVRIAGQMAVSRLVEQLAPYEPARWFCRDSKSELSAG
jgi:hypothetical protein